MGDGCMRDTADALCKTDVNIALARCSFSWFYAHGTDFIPISSVILWATHGEYGLQLHLNQT